MCGGSGRGWRSSGEMGNACHVPGAVVFLGLYVYALSIEDGEAWDSIKQCVVFYGGIGLAAWIKEKYFPGDEEPS